MNPPALLWALINNEIQTHPITTTEDHGELWGHTTCDNTYKGRYNPQTQHISIINPANRINFPIPQYLLDLLHQTFTIAHIDDH